METFWIALLVMAAVAGQGKLILENIFWLLAQPFSHPQHNPKLVEHSRSSETALVNVLLASFATPIRIAVSVRPDTN
jgi:hypothetical protein